MNHINSRNLNFSELSFNIDITFIIALYISNLKFIVTDYEYNYI